MSDVTAFRNTKRHETRNTRPDVDGTVLSQLHINRITVGAPYTLEVLHGETRTLHIFRDAKTKQVRYVNAIVGQQRFELQPHHSNLVV